MTSWIDEMSTFIKKLAPRTLVSVGDEGWFNKPGLEDSW